MHPRTVDAKAVLATLTRGENVSDGVEMLAGVNHQGSCGSDSRALFSVICDLEFSAVPMSELGRGFVGALEEIEQRRVWIVGGLYRRVGKEELAKCRVVRRRLWLDLPLGKTRWFRIRV